MISTLAALALLLTSQVRAEEKGRFGRSMGSAMRSPSRGSGQLDYTVYMSGAPPADCDGTALPVTGATFAITRAMAGYCQRHDGLLVLVPSNAPRANQNGLLVEGARTNKVIRSQEFTTSWTAQNLAVGALATAPDGTSTAATLTLSAVNSSDHRIYSAGHTETAAVWSRSVYVKAGTAGFVGLSPNNSVTQYVVVNLSTGATVASAGSAYVYTEQVTSGWWRVHFVHTSAAATRYVSIHPGDTAAHATPGATAWTPAGTETVLVWGAQAELGDISSTYIPTTTVELTRPADVATLTFVTSISATGCMSATVTTGPRYPGTMRWLNPSGGAMSGTANEKFHMHDNANAIEIFVIPNVLSRSVFVKGSWGAGTMSLEAEAFTASGTFDGTMGSSPVYVGSQAGSTGFVFGYIKGVKLHNVKTGCGL